MDEALESDPHAYETFNAFFTRALKPDARPVVEGEKELACPVDGAVSQARPIEDGRIFQAKGHDYSLEQLLGGSAERAEPFQGGSFATIYLSPRDYHRIHMPISGTLREMVHVPGRLFSVNPATTRVIPGLFARNERVVSIFDTEVGPMAMVKVGAVNVGSVETVWAGEVTPPAGRVVRSWRYRDDEAVTLEKGEEMGRFNMGSTVIIVFGPEAVVWSEEIQPGAPVRLGQLLATAKK
jgi:phosphatidylserine decarboxylase